MLRRILAVTLPLCITFCASAQDDLPFQIEDVRQFNEPWALDFLPDGQLLVTEKKGNLYLTSQDGEESRSISGVPEVDYGGQGGLGDVAVHPDFSSNGYVYLSYAEAGTDNTRGAAVARGVLDADSASLSDVEVIWRQYPKMLGRGHYGHRIAFHDGYLWISSGDRQKFTPAQDMQANLGKILRLNDDGSVPDDNPFVEYRDENPKVDDEGVYAQVWSLGHRNPLGIAFDAQGQLWDIEMGPAGGDELNRVVRGENYGYPVVSNGDHYDGRDIPDHDTRPEFAEPAEWWTPVISPGDLTIYQGDMFADWQGDALAAGLSSEAIVRVALNGENAEEVERYEMGARIRSVVEGPNGALWVLEDGGDGRLLKLTPRG